MSAIIQSGATSDLLTIDPTSKAARSTLYDSAGRELSFHGKQTFVATTGTFSPPATPTDMATITGSATKTVRVLAVYFASTQTTYGTNTIFLTKRSTANSGGTSSAITVVPLDSGNASGTATVASYTANPTTGSLVGNINTKRVVSPVVTTTSMQSDLGTDMLPQPRGGLLEQPVILRGTGEVLAVNFGGASLPSGLSVTVTFLWTEE